MMRSKIAKRRRAPRGGYERMMETLLLQNQQIIIQQQNMLFMFIKQQQHGPSGQQLPQGSALQNQHQNHQHQPQQQQHQPPSQHHHHHQSQQEQHQQQHNQHSQHNGHHQITNEDPTMQSHQLFSQASNSSIVDTQQQLQQVAAQLQEHQGSYLTPAASEQDPISDKQEDEDLAALLDGDGLLHNNFLYNPQTDIGSITPYKSQPNQHQTPSYYSSGCESLTTPRVEQQRPATTANISQNVVKNLADSFKSPTKPKINVQIMSSSATGSMKNSKAKIIQSMNISQFLRHVHPETEAKTSSQ